MCCENSDVIAFEELRTELKRLRWEAELREEELDRLYKLEDQLKRMLYATQNT